MRILLALALLAFSGLAGAQSAVNCAPATPCSSTTGPSNTGTGDPAWKAYGKINENLNGTNTIAASTTGNAATATALAAAPTTCASSHSPTGIDVNGNAVGCFAPGGSGTVTATTPPAQYQTPAFTSATDIKGVGPGTSGQVFTSNGPGQYASFQSGVDLNGVTAATTAAGADLALIYSQSATADRGITLTNLFTSILAAPPDIGGTTPSTGEFSNITASGTVAVTGNLTTNVTGSTQCVHANTSGVLSGTGSDCGAGGGGTARAIFSYTCTTLSQNTTNYCVQTGGLTAGANGALVPAGTLKNLYVQTTNAPASGQTFTFTVMSGNFGALSASTITCQETSSGSTCNDTTHTATTTAGQGWTVRAATSATSASTGVFAITLEFDPS